MDQTIAPLPAPERWTAQWQWRTSRPVATPFPF